MLLAGLVLATPRGRARHSIVHRRFALALIALVSTVNLISLGLLVHYLLRGGKAGGHPLIVAGLVLWVTNVLVFGLWYWELDRGGPISRQLDKEAMPDFMFVQMAQPDVAPEGWRPTFVDYLYTSFTNATAFSPTDTMPLSPIAKVLMAVQAAAALLSVALVLARAVNILS